jgi:phenylalanyl-tRNA synthetase alpha chain
MSFHERITELEQQVRTATATTADELEKLRVALLGRNGSITALFDAFKAVPPEEKRSLGPLMNSLKQLAQQRLDELRATADEAPTQRGPAVDLSAPALTSTTGSLHPLTVVRQRIVDIFTRLGYTVSQGPEVEDDRHNFSALNFPPDHPARDMQDTFFVQGGELALRTHTSSVQVRVMEAGRPPFRTISPGRVYRNEAISARAHCMFHQVEALYVDEHVSFADLKGTLDLFTKSLFGPEVSIRMRPSYFPFTEPSAEVDMSCTVCGGSGCSLCKQSGWVEIMGCGMVDPAVLANCGIDPERYSGFALGMGIERITQLIYRVPDLRMYWENDVRFLDQFKAAPFRG